MRDLFDTIIDTEEMITRKKRPAAKKKAKVDRQTLVEAMGGREENDSFFDLDHAVAGRSNTDDLDWTTGWSGEDDGTGDDSDEY